MQLQFMVRGGPLQTRLQRGVWLQTPAPRASLLLPDPPPWRARGPARTLPSSLPTSIHHHPLLFFRFLRQNDRCGHLRGCMAPLGRPQELRQDQAATGRTGQPGLHRGPLGWSCCATNQHKAFRSGSMWWKSALIL